MARRRQDSEGIERVRAGLAVDEAAVDRIQQAIRIDPKALELATQIRIDPKLVEQVTSSWRVDTEALQKAAQIRIDPKVFDRVMNSFEIDPKAFERITKSFSIDPDVLEKAFLNVRLDAAAVERMTKAIQINLEALQNLQVDQAMVRLARTHVARIGEPAEPPAETIEADSQTLQEAATGQRVDAASELAGVYDALSPEQRRELRNRLLAVVVALAVYVDRLAAEQLREAAFALLGLLLVELFLYTSVVNALDDLEDERDEGRD